MMNDHLGHFNKMFRLGSHHPNGSRRIAEASKSSNVLPPPLYGLRKTHKQNPNGQQGPAMRPVCGAKEAPNSRFSRFCSKVVTDIADMVGDSRECRSSEEMRAAFEAFNSNVDVNVRKKTIIFSKDAKALFPSMQKEVCKMAIIWIIDKEEVNIDNMDWTQVTRYIAVNMSPEDIEKEGLTNVIPGRVKVTRRKLTMNSLSVNTADNDWQQSAPPNETQKRKLLGLVMAMGVEVKMSNHSFMLGDDVFLQTNGGPIGLEFTGSMSRVVMMWWDHLYLQKCLSVGLNMVIYEHFVDDSNQAVEVPDDDTARNVLLKLENIANSILPGINMEVDLPSNHSDAKLPILDMKCFMEDGYLMYEHYEKLMATKLIISL